MNDYEKDYHEGHKEHEGKETMNKTLDAVLHLRAHRGDSFVVIPSSLAFLIPAAKNLVPAAGGFSAGP